MQRIGIVGARGYAGNMLHALLMHHPCMTPVRLDARTSPDAQRSILLSCSAVALAIPDDAARAWVSDLRGLGVRVIDLSTAHRCNDGVHYGIPELFGAPPPSCRLVANPGCYPTAALLALRPLREAGLIEPGTPVAILGSSGTSGAGKALRDDLHFSELHGNAFPYAVGEHKHIPEIERYLEHPISFVTQLLPVARGLTVTAFVRTQSEPEELRGALQTRYADSPHVSVLPRPDQALGLRHAVGTHHALLAVGPQRRGDLVPVFSTIDNLLRGAASSAVATLNQWLGLDPNSGLPQPSALTPGGLAGMPRMLA